MRIAVVSRGFSAYRGGAERFTASLCNRLAGTGHEVTLFSSEPLSSLPEKIRFQTVSIQSLFAFLKILSFHWSVRKTLKRDQFDVVYGICQFFPLDLFYAGGGVHRHWMKLRYPWFPFRTIKYLLSPVHLAMIWLEGKIFDAAGCNLIVTNSRLVRSHIQTYYSTPDSRIEVIYDGVDQSVFNPGVRSHRMEMRNELGLLESDIVMIHASNNWKRKGLETILHAMQSLPERFKLVVAGRGKSIRYLRLSRKLKIAESRLIFTGNTPHIERIYGMGDCFVLPTLYDPCAQVCREAMSCGLPVITTRNNGASELIDHGTNGFILGHWKDHQSLYAFLETFLDDDLRKGFGEAARNSVKNCSWEKNAAQHLELFTRMKFPTGNDND